MKQPQKVELAEESLEFVAGGAKTKKSKKNKETTETKETSNEMNIEGQNNNEGTIVNTSGNGATVKTIQNINTNGGDLNINL